MSILTGPEILNQVEAGRIVVDPFNPKRVNVTSLDLTLGSQVAVYEEFTLCDAADHQVAQGKPYDGSNMLPFNASRIYDTKKPSNLRRFEINPRFGWVVQPGIGYLMHTVERICTNFYNPVLDGKSSIGRLFVKVHETAGYGDPGFNGQYTLEVTASMFPVRLYPGMRICQIRFHTLEGTLKSYEETGHYKGDAAQGAVGSKIHESAFDD